MKVEMEDVLAGIRTGVEHNPITAGLDLLGRGDGRDLGQDVLEEIHPVGRHLVERSEMIPRDDQGVHRRLGPDVVEGDDPVILVDDLGRKLLGRDPAENAISFHGDPPWPLRTSPRESLLDALDPRSELAELGFDGFVPAVDVFDLVDDGFASGDETGQEKTGRSPEVRSDHFRSGQP